MKKIIIKLNLNKIPLPRLMWDRKPQTQVQPNYKASTKRNLCRKSKNRRRDDDD